MLVWLLVSISTARSPLVDIRQQNDYIVTTALSPFELGKDEIYSIEFGKSSGDIAYKKEINIYVPPKQGWQ